MISINQQKYITSLHLKKYRQKYRNFLVEGEKMLKELLNQQKVQVKQVFGTAEWADAAAADLISYQAIFQEVTEAELQKISTLTTPNGVLAIAEIPEPPVIPNPVTGYILYLDGLQDPGNMGAVLRIADWFGISIVCCSPDCADAFSPKVVQAGMGACLRVPVLENIKLSEIVEEQAVIGALLEGENLFSAALPDSGILVIGNEGKGIRPENLPLISHKITIPKAPGGGAESLNAGVATGIIIAELFRKNG